MGNNGFEACIFCERINLVYNFLFWCSLTCSPTQNIKVLGKNFCYPEKISENNNDVVIWKSMTNGHILKIHSNNVALQEQTLQIDK